MKTVTRTELSVLIPVYNDACLTLVKRLQQLCRDAVDSGRLLNYEIIVSDDGSTDDMAVAANRIIDTMQHCRYILRQHNSGSAANRNLLAKESSCQWLLYVDSDIDIPDDDFIAYYLNAPEADVVMGGIRPEYPVDERNLRYLYESSSRHNHTAQARARRPYQSFRSCNFMIRRTVMLKCPFDERFLKSGYEDVMLGKQLKMQRHTIVHIENPVVMTHYEPNADYVGKMERSIQTLYRFHDELRGYSRLLTAADGIHLGIVRRTAALLFRITAPLIRRNLTGKKPCLALLNPYRLGYYIWFSQKRHNL